MDLHHVRELQHSIGGEGPRHWGLAEEREAAASDFECYEALVTFIDKCFGLCPHPGRDRAGALHMLKDHYVRVGNGSGLLEASVRLSEDAVESFDHLAECIRIDS